MSFSPTIDTFGYVYANIFAEEGYTFEQGPIPNYFRPIPAGHAELGGFATGGFMRILEDNGEIYSMTTDYTRTPYPLPTLKTIAGGPSSFSYDVNRLSYDFGFSYLRLWTCAVHSRFPPSSPETSGFFSWDQGFGFGISQSLYGYMNTDPGSADEGPTPVNFADYGAPIEGDLKLTEGQDELMSSIIKIFGYNCEDAVEYIENDIAESPYHCITITRDYYGTGAKYPSSMAEADSLPTILEFDQVLYATNVRSININQNYVFKSDGSFATRPTPTHRSSGFTNYPKVSTPSVQSDGFTGDLELYRANVINNYSLYEYVKNDIIERFHSRDEVTTTRDQYVSDIVAKYNNLLGSTFDVPRDYRTKRQPSPKSLRKNYTSFGYDMDLQVTTDDTTTGTTSMGTMPTTGGGSSGGTYS